MGQFSRFVERSFEPPPVVLRIFNVVAPVAATIQAVATRRLEHILLAVFLVGMLLPSGIAPGGAAQVAARLEARPLLGSFLFAVLLSCGGFAFLANFLSRRTSLLVAVGLALLAVISSEIKRRRAPNSPRPDGRGELGQ